MIILPTVNRYWKIKRFYSYNVDSAYLEGICLAHHTGHRLSDKCVLCARVDIDKDTTDVINYATKLSLETSQVAHWQARSVFRFL